jgi:hypothetical protein
VLGQYKQVAQSFINVCKVSKNLRLFHVYFHAALGALHIILHVRYVFNQNAQNFAKT